MPRDFGTIEKHTGAMIALVPTEEWSSFVNTEAWDNGERASDLHSTLLFLGEAIDWSASSEAAVRDAMSNFTMRDFVLAPVTGPATFNPSGDNPAHVLVLTGRDLRITHDAVVQAMKPWAELIPSQFDPWVPHITLAYGGDEPKLSPEVRDEPVPFDRLRVVFAGRTTDYPFMVPPKDATTPPLRRAGNEGVDQDAKPSVRRVMVTTKAARTMSVEFKHTGVHHVATPAGVRKYDQPIGAIIVRDMPLKNLLTSKNPDPEYPTFMYVVDKKGKEYSVGPNDRGKGFIATRDDSWDELAAGKTMADALVALDASLAVKKAKTTTARKVVTPKTTPSFETQPKVKWTKVRDQGSTFMLNGDEAMVIRKEVGGWAVTTRGGFSGLSPTKAGAYQLALDQRKLERIAEVSKKTPAKRVVQSKIPVPMVKPSVKRVIKPKDAPDLSMRSAANLKTDLRAAKPRSRQANAIHAEFARRRATAASGPTSYNEPMKVDNGWDTVNSDVHAEHNLMRDGEAVGNIHLTPSNGWVITTTNGFSGTAQTLARARTLAEEHSKPDPNEADPPFVSQQSLAQLREAVKRP